MDSNIINQLLKYSLFLLIPDKNKLELINDNTIDLSQKIKLIKSLNSNNKIKLLTDIYVYENINFTEEELILIFKSLSCNDKITIQKKLPEKEYKYLEYLSPSEANRIITQGSLKIEDRIYIIDNILSQKQREDLYKHAYLNSKEIIAIIKHFDEEKRRKIILKKQGQIKNLNSYEYVSALCCLPTIEEKLLFLNDDNEYNIKLNLDQKIELIIVTNDKEKIKFIEENNIANYKIKDVFISLSDEGKLYFIKRKAELRKYLTYYISEFYSSLSENLAREVIKNKEVYNIGKDKFEYLINCLSPQERLEYINDLDIDKYQRYSIIANLPEDYKLELLKPNNIYNINLNKEQLIVAAKNLNLKNLIEILVKNHEKYYKFEIEDIWKIIESRSEDDAILLFKKEDKEIKSFVNKYKTSLVKCLDDQDKIDIIYNRSKYGIHLEDNRKLKILKTIYTCHTKEVFEENIFKYFDNPQKVIDKLISDKNLFNSLDSKLKNQLVEFYIEKKENPEFINLCINILTYVNNSKEILENFDTFQTIFTKLNINLLDFIQYGINSNKYKWDEMILIIIKNNKFEEFSKVKNYFFNNYYLQDNHKKNNVENFLEILNAYTKYETFCKNLTKENKILTELDKLDIRYLFNSKEKIKPENIETINKIRNEKIKHYQDIANKSNNIHIIKDTLLQLFFNKDRCSIHDVLSKTGGVKELNILKFNNKENKEYTKAIEHVILMTEFIERIITTQDLSGLKETLKKYTSEDHLEETRKYINYFSKYEEYIRKIYELDVQISLTDINMLDDSFSKTDKALSLSKEYGGKVIDLSESQYVLIGHVKSSSESIDNLLSGTSDGNSNFICTSPVSHRGQHYYAYHEYSTVFAYDQIPKDSFICSSIDNLGSNHSLSYNTSEVPEFIRVQKGILETSEAASHKNAEMLLYREGMKPCGIIIPTDTVPSKDAIKYHQKYNIPFIITQKIDETIENPKKIATKNKEIDISEFNNIEIPNKITKENPQERKIAILTDPHALYEPTMACLTDIKNKEITEIYSLGDNIGHGPSPKETLDILKQHNVKSILGNHELYIIEDNAMEIFKEHLEKANALERTTDMTNWVKQEITKEQFDEMKEYQKKYDIITPQGEKITLIHTIEAYNPSGKYSETTDLSDSDMILQGHLHFAYQIDGNYILRAVGMGQKEADDGKATYAILTIKEDGYDIEIQTIPYNRSNLLHTINESSMPTKSKSLIKSWVINPRK